MNSHSDWQRSSRKKESRRTTKRGVNKMRMTRKLGYSIDDYLEQTFGTFFKMQEFYASYLTTEETDQIEQILKEIETLQVLILDHIKMDNEPLMR